MRCLKCGQNTSSGQVFCDACLADMEKHPVAPGTPIVIPNRTKPLPARRSHKIYKPDEVIITQRRIIRWMALIILLLLLAVAATTYAMFHYRGLVQDACVTPQLWCEENVSRETFFDTF